MNRNLVFFDYDIKVNSSKPIEKEEDYNSFITFVNTMKLLAFERELKLTSPDKINDLIDFHLRFFKRTYPKGNIDYFINELKKVQLSKLNKHQVDIFKTYIENYFSPSFESEYSKDNPLKNYNLMIKNYTNFFLFVDMDFERVFKDSKALSQTGIIRVCDWANKEIELQFFNDFERFKVLQNKIESECLELLSKHELIVKKHNLYNAQNIPQYIFYFQVMQHFHDFYDEFCKLKIETKQTGKKTKNVTETFESLFYEEKYADISIRVLHELDPPVVNSNGDFIGNNKGIINVWIDCMLNFSPNPIMKKVSFRLLAKLLNSKIGNLKLSENGSEFGKAYKRIKEKRVSLEMSTLFSKFST